MMKKILVILCILSLLSGNLSAVFAANSDQSTPYTQLRTVDLWTFNEYKYKLTEQFFTLRNDFEVSWTVKESTIISIFKIAKESYNYLPDNLANKNLYKKLEIALAKAAKYPGNESIYLALVDELDSYLEDVRIESIKGSVNATPSKWNAPLSVTLRGDVKDGTWTKIPEYNYVWWVDDAGKRKVIGNKPSIHYVFREEGTFSVFLDVTSSHKNSLNFTDVLPFRSRADIVVKEKIASLIIKVNSDNLRDSDELKFTPEEAAYGLVFDATSSTPTGGAKFTKTEWEFWNGIKRSNTGEPEIERIKYTKEGEYTVKLKLRTNEWKTVERNFTVNVHDPIATVHASKEQGYLGDKFTFSAKPTGSDDNLSYDWEIIDIDFDKSVFNKSWKTFTYTFPKKGKFNVQLRVTEPSGEVDIDTKIIYINSRAPVAEYTYRIPHSHQPNTVLLDASKSYDLDGIDDGKLTYEWIIDGERVTLNDASFNGAVWYYTFDSIESHSVLLRVSDPEWISSQVTKKVVVKSILSVDFAAYPRVTQREVPINFQADSVEANVFAWDFGDGTIKSGKNSNITHKYKESGIYNVKLQVSDAQDNINMYTKKVYIWDSNAPLAHVSVKSAQRNVVGIQTNQCYWEDAYMVDRAWSVTFTADESIDVTWKKWGLTYSWKLGKNKYFSNVTFTQKFDELGCFPIQLAVKSVSKGKTDKVNTWVKVENLKPTLSSVDVQVVDGDADPVVVKVSALWAKDPDGVIQSYLWYYYTDIDPEPQDFRATKQANTTFVLPKVTGNYYFVVLMKDNNEVRISSEEITGSKYFITLTWDNINVPLVSLGVDDSSISVWQEVLFTAEVENILGYNLSKKSEYSWDLDGDGFYEQKTNAPSLLYTYERSGEFYAKVKAKYKWYSNTKSITMNVSNLLKPEVEYISVGNKYILLNTSIWKADSVKWDLWDGTKVSDSSSFIHTYEWNKGSFDVSLELKEGIKVEKETFKLIKNFKNLIAARKQGLVIFSNKNIEENIITIEDNKDKLYLYLWESKGEEVDQITDFIIDTNIEYDSNLNGGKDDDNDIQISYWKNDNIIEIKLNDLREQNININAYDIDRNLLYSQELQIVKEFIEETEIDINSIEFKWVTQSELVNIEELKSEIKKLPKEYRLKSLMYVQKLQEEWFDPSEKTKVIIEFEGYIQGLDSPNATTIYTLLESLLLEGEDDKTEKNLMFVALKNLTPTNIECELSTDISGWKCYNAIIDRLDIIKVNNDIDENKALAKEILEAIAIYPDMSNADKNNFKAILSSFVYWGVDNMPEVEKNTEIAKPNTNQTDEWSDGEDSAIFWVIKTILFIFVVIIWIFFWIFILFFIFYKISNKDDNVGFQDFIIEKTSGHKKKIVVQKDETEDILKELWNDLWDKKWEFKNSQTKPEVKKEVVKDPLEAIGNPAEVSQVKTNKEEVPDWLKWNFSDENKSTSKTETKQEIKSEIKNNVRWENKVVDKEERKNISKPYSNNNQKPTQVSSDKKEVKKDDWDVPDWLKWSFTEETKTISKDETREKTEIKSKIKNNVRWENKVVDKEESKNISKPYSNNNQKSTQISSDKKEVKKDDWEIPDWLKGAIDTEDKKEEISENKSQNIPEKVSEKQDTPKMETQEDLDKITDIKEVKNTEIPDWLKWSFDEEKKSEPKKDAKKDEIPDWLKWSLDETTTNTTSSKDKKSDIDNVSDKKEVSKSEINAESDEILDNSEEEKKVELSKDIKSKSEEWNVNEWVEVIKEDTKEEVKKEAAEEVKEEVKEEIKEETIKIEPLKEEKKIIKEEKIVKTIQKKTLPEDTVISEEVKIIEKTSEKKSNKKEEEKVVKKEDDVKKEEEKIVEKKPKTKRVWKPKAKKVDIEEKKETLTEQKQVEKKKTEDELWDDGMKIPDWLKTDEDK